MKSALAGDRGGFEILPVAVAAELVKGDLSTT
jgi:hypothetical protein